jgi:hypothetical protein
MAGTAVVNLGNDHVKATVGDRAERPDVQIDSRKLSSSQRLPYSPIDVRECARAVAATITGVSATSCVLVPARFPNSRLERRSLRAGPSDHQLSETKGTLDLAALDVDRLHVGKIDRKWA